MTDTAQTAEIPPPAPDKPEHLRISAGLCDVIRKVEHLREHKSALVKAGLMLSTLASRHARGTLGYYRGDVVAGAAYLLCTLDFLDGVEPELFLAAPPARPRPKPLGHPAYRDDSCPERECDYCHKPYRGPAVYCSLDCAIADA